MARISGQLQRKKAVFCGGTADPPASRDRLSSVFTAMRAPGSQTAMHRGRLLRALWCMVSLLFSFAYAFAEDAGEATRLGVEPRAIPAETPAEGTPQSDEIRTVERFTPTADYSRIDYTLTTTDAANFERPFTLTRYFVWKPENTVHKYECLDRF